MNSGMTGDQFQSMSGAARFEHQRIAMAEQRRLPQLDIHRERRYNPMNTGNCKNTGKQPASGLMLCLRYSSCVACDFFCMSVLYFSLMRSISGLSAWIRAMFCVCL